MTFVQDLETKFSEVKDKVEGDLHALVLKLEAVFSRVHQAQVAEGLKQAISTDIHAAVTHVAAVADTLRSDVDVVAQVVDTADDAVDKAATK